MAFQFSLVRCVDETFESSNFNYFICLHIINDFISKEKKMFKSRFFGDETINKPHLYIDYILLQCSFTQTILQYLIKYISIETNLRKHDVHAI